MDGCSVPERINAYNHQFMCVLFSTSGLVFITGSRYNPTCFYGIEASTYTVTSCYCIYSKDVQKQKDMKWAYKADMFFRVPTIRDTVPWFKHSVIRIRFDESNSKRIKAERVHFTDIF